MGIWIRHEVRKRCADVLDWYRDRHGRPRTKEEFRRIAEELRTYYGEDYGHGGELDKMVTIANCCFDDEASTNASESVAGRSAVTGRTALRTSSPISPPDKGGPGRGEHSANIKLADGYGRTAVWWAAADGDAETLRALIGQGADVKAGDLDQETPLHCAARWGRTSAVDLLLQAGAGVNARTIYGATPLHLAVRESQLGAVSMLLTRGADANMRDTFGCTPLHDAAAKGDGKLVVLLLASGAHVYAQDSFGTTPLHRAARAGHADVVALLQKKGAHATATNAFGRTALDEAVFSEHGPTLRSLTQQQRRPAEPPGRTASSERGKQLPPTRIPTSPAPRPPLGQPGK